MTDEQIKQNAWNDLGRHSPCDENEWIDGYVVGAHSRDEEIAYLTYRLNDTTEKLQTVIAERDQLRNPWISVEERLPEDGQKIFVLLKSGNILIDACFESYRVDISLVTHWMPIPQLPINN